MTKQFHFYHLHGYLSENLYRIEIPYYIFFKVNIISISNTIYPEYLKPKQQFSNNSVYLISSTFESMPMCKNE